MWCAWKRGLPSSPHGLGLNRRFAKAAVVEGATHRMYIPFRDLLAGLLQLHRIPGARVGEVERGKSVEQGGDGAPGDHPDRERKDPYVGQRESPEAGRPHPPVC